MAFQFNSPISETRMKKLFKLACDGFKYYDPQTKQNYFTSLPVGFEREIAVYKDGHTLIYDNYDRPINAKDEIIPFATLDDDPNTIIKKWESTVKNHNLEKEMYDRAKVIYDLQHSSIVAFD